MAQQYPAWIWHNGRIKPWAEGTTHVMAHALHYGSSVFEGMANANLDVIPKADHFFASHGLAELVELVRSSIN